MCDFTENISVLLEILLRIDSAFEVEMKLSQTSNLVRYAIEKYHSDYPKNVRLIFDNINIGKLHFSFSYVRLLLTSEQIGDLIFQYMKDCHLINNVPRRCVTIYSVRSVPIDKFNCAIFELYMSCENIGDTTAQVKLIFKKNKVGIRFLNKIFIICDEFLDSIYFHWPWAPELTVRLSPHSVIRNLTKILDIRGCGISNSNPQISNIENKISIFLQTVDIGQICLSNYLWINFGRHDQFSNTNYYINRLFAISNVNFPCDAMFKDSIGSQIIEGVIKRIKNAINSNFTPGYDCCTNSSEWMYPKIIDVITQSSGELVNININLKKQFSQFLKLLEGKCYHCTCISSIEDELDRHVSPYLNKLVKENEYITDRKLELQWHKDAIKCARGYCYGRYVLEGYDGSYRNGLNPWPDSDDSDFSVSDESYSYTSDLDDFLDDDQLTEID
jgi:hypothetical protein